MKFGRRLQEEAFPDFESHYISYKDLKKAIKLITGSDTSHFTISQVTNNFGNIPALAGSTYRPPESRFQDLLNFEVHKINGFSALVYSSISSTLQAALKQLYHGEITTLEELNELRSATEFSADGVAHLHSYVRLNFIGFRKITKKYDKHNKSSASAFYLARLVKEQFVNLNFDFLIELISICFFEMRRIKRVLLRRLETHVSAEDDDLEDEEEDDVDMDEDTAPLTEPAEMTNTTYLVGEQHMMRVRVHLAKHIPLMSLGPVRCPKPSREIVRSFVNGIPDHHQQGSTMVRVANPPDGKIFPSSVKTSLMLDVEGRLLNPAIYKFEQHRVSGGCLFFDDEELTTYKQLLSPQVDENNAEVLRLRWDKDELADEALNFVVLEVAKAFAPADSPNEWHDVPVNNNEGNVPKAVKIRRSLIPSLLDGTSSIASILADLKLPSDRTEDVKSLLERAVQMLQVQQPKSEPFFQEWTHRTNFRKLGANVTRRMYAHLDESIRFTDAAHQMLKDPNYSSFWIPPHLAPYLDDTDIHCCPYGVLSISLAGNCKPKFLPKITGLTTVSEVWRYAPQLHGIALFRRAQLASSDLPHWFQFVTTDTEDIRNPTTPSSKGADSKLEEGRHGQRESIRMDVMTPNPGSRLFHEHAVTLQQQHSLTDPYSPPTEEQRRGSLGMAFSTFNEPLLQSHAAIPVESSSAFPYQALSTPPRVASNARTPLISGVEQHRHDSGLLSLCGNISALIPEFPPWLSIWRSPSGPSVPIGAAAVRVEPKTFFANERTLLQWMNTAVLLSTISITLLNFGTSTGRLAGLIMAPVALFFIIYSFGVYLRRSYSLERKEPINYNDRVGPAILVMCLICALSAIILLNLFYGPGNELNSMVTPTIAPVAPATTVLSASTSLPHLGVDFLAKTG